MTLGSESPSEASRPRWIITSGACVYTMTRWALWKPLSKVVIYWGGTFYSKSSKIGVKKQRKKKKRLKPSRTESWTLEQAGKVIKAWTGSWSSWQNPHPTPQLCCDFSGDTWHFVKINLFSVTWDEGPWSDRCFSLMWFKANLFTYLFILKELWGVDAQDPWGCFVWKRGLVFFFFGLMKKGDETKNTSSGVGVFFIS